eukprot:maker-scaffold_72-snap-gene-0.52-mRNA-1 protein AED:0.00 eAED:0.00 QI:195/1/1/1/1/1/2/125/162
MRPPKKSRFKQNRDSLFRDSLKTNLDTTVLETQSELSEKTEHITPFDPPENLTSSDFYISTHDAKYLAEKNSALYMHKTSPQMQEFYRQISLRDEILEKEGKSIEIYVPHELYAEHKEKEKERKRLRRKALCLKIPLITGIVLMICSLTATTVYLFLSGVFR